MIIKLIVSDITHSLPILGRSTPLTTAPIVMAPCSKPSLKRKTKVAKPALPKCSPPKLNNNTYVSEVIHNIWKKILCCHQQLSSWLQVTQVYMWGEMFHINWEIMHYKLKLGSIDTHDKNASKQSEM